MMRGGVATRHYGWRGPRNSPWPVAGSTSAGPAQPGATWRFNPATMHGGVQWFCPAMHGGEAKRPRFEKSLQTGLNLKFVLKMG